MQNHIEKSYQYKLTIDELADKVNTSRRSFERRFKQATNNTPVEYMQGVRIEAAKRSFEASRKNVSEVMFYVGYSDTLPHLHQLRMIHFLSFCILHYQQINPGHNRGGHIDCGCSCSGMDDIFFINQQAAAE